MNPSVITTLLVPNTCVLTWRKKNVTSKVVKQVQIVVPNTAHPSPLLRIVFIV